MATTSIEIGSGTWTIEEIPSDSPELLRMEAIGVCKNAEKRLLITDEGCDDAYYQTLFHEIVHAIAKENNLTFNDDEDAVDRLGLALYGLFKQNNWVIPKELQRAKK